MANTWTVSISQWERFSDPNDGCERKWGLDRDSEYHESLGAYRGVAAHAMLRAWGEHAVAPEKSLPGIIAHLHQNYEGDLADKRITAEDYAARIVSVVNKMSDLLPAPKWPGTFATERKFKISFDGVPWGGKKDLETPEYLYDFKIVWASSAIKSTTELLTDAQANLYAYDILQRRSELDRVRARWVYGVPGPSPSARIVEADLPRDHVRAQVERLNVNGKRIYQLALAKPDPMTLEPNWNACASYGGCPHRDKCKPTLEDISFKFKDDQTKGANTMGLKDLIKGEAESKTTTAEATAEQTKTESTPSAPDPKLADAVLKARGQLRLGVTKEEVEKSIAQMFDLGPKSAAAAVADAVASIEMDEKSKALAAEAEKKSADTAKATAAASAEETKRPRGRPAKIEAGATESSSLPAPLPLQAAFTALQAAVLKRATEVAAGGQVNEVLQMCEAVAKISLVR